MTEMRLTRETLLLAASLAWCAILASSLVYIIFSVVL